MTMTTEELARLQEEAAKAREAAQEAANVLRQEEDAAEAAREERRREWGRRYVEGFDRQALRDRTRKAHAQLVAAVESDPLGRALIEYLTAALTEYRRLAHHDLAATLARLDGPRFAEDIHRRPRDARGPIDDPQTWAAGALARAVGDLALGSAEQVEQDFQSSLDHYVNDGSGEATTAPPGAPAA